MDQFRKIELNTDSKDTITTAPQKMAQKKIRIKLPRRLLVSLGVVLAIFVLFGVVIAFPAYSTYKSAMATQAQAKKAWAAIKTQDIEKAGIELSKTEQSLKDTQKNLHSMSLLKFVPIASWYYNDADHLVNAGFHGLKSSAILVESIKPYADVLGLKGQGTFTGGSAEQRIQLAVTTMGKITPRIDEISDNLVKARDEIDQVKASHYPPILGGKKIHDQLKQMQLFVDQSVSFVDEARPLIKVMPQLMGESEEKKYLVLFQNDKELRPTGGFITAYAIFKIEKGVFKIERSDDIYPLDNSISDKPTAPRPILSYLPKVSVLNLRDSNLSPDFVESMKTFNSLYNKAGQKVEVDGIIALDTHVLVSVLKILDDEITAAGITFNTKNDARCDCPQVIYELEDQISRPVGYVKEDRKGLLGTLLYALMEKALKSSPKQYWGSLFQELVNQTNQKHILFYVFDTKAQSGVEALNAAGRIKTLQGDYLHINEANMGGAKANLYTTEEVNQNIQVTNDGTIKKTLTIQYKNPHEPSDCNLERGGLCLNAPLRNWVRIYVPQGSKLVDYKGSEVKMETYEELGKTVFEGFLTVRPQGAATLTITYSLPFKLTKDSPLPILIQKQPGTDNFKYKIQVNGKTREEFDLSTDKKFSLNI